MKSAEQGNYTCVVCPVGCELEVVKTSDEWEVQGARCPRGVDYGLQEHLDPRRVLTMVVSVMAGSFPVVSARTSGPIPRDKLLEAACIARRTSIKAPVRIGQVLIKGIADTKTDLVATAQVDLVPDPV
jgi:CxxC motif-containing protein